MAIWKLVSREAEWGPVAGSYCCQQLEQLFSFMLQRCSATWELFKRFGKMFLLAVANINTSFCRHSVFAVLAGLAHLDHPHYSKLSTWDAQTGFANRMGSPMSILILSVLSEGQKFYRCFI